jgi:hypothetical protein
MDDFNKAWKASRPQMPESETILKRIYSEGSKRRKEIRQFHTGNIIVLGVFLLVLIAGYLYLNMFRQVLTQTGIIIMIGVMAARVIIESLSLFKVNALPVADQTSVMTNSLLKLYNIRRIIHGPVTISLVVLYLTGVGMLIPEWTNYFNNKLLFLMFGGFLVTGFVIIVAIRKAIVKEMANISAMSELQKQISKAE